MSYLLGVDTGGTYTDAVILDTGADQIIGSAKSLTTRANLAIGIGKAIDAAVAGAGVEVGQIGMVSLSTTLATNALVEGQGERVALVAIGFDEADLGRAGLAEALGSDPLIQVMGGHTHAGAEAAPLDEAALIRQIGKIASEVDAFAIASHFATRNSAHERRARDLIRDATGRPVTCSHELSAQLNGPRRALTAVLNARLIGMIDRLVTACEGHLQELGLTVPLMVVRGDGALISARVVRERPIETILSGPAASIVGARWLTGEADALVSDIGGTTTDVALLRDGLPEIDPAGARVGPFRTMVEAVAVRTTGLGGDSEVRMETDQPGTPLHLGPRRRIPVSALAIDHPEMVHQALDKALAGDLVGDHDGLFAVPMGGVAPGLSPRDAALLARISAPMPVGKLLNTRLEGPALDRLVARGLVMISGVTPSDASHVLGRLDAWDREAAEKALTVFARQKTPRGDRLAPDAEALATRIVDQLTTQTVDCLMEAAFAEDAGFAGEDPTTLARHVLTRQGLAQHRGIVETSLRLGVPLVGLGASAPNYYRAVGDRLGCRVVLPDHAGVANAIGAVVGQVSQRLTGSVTSPGEGRFTVHLVDGNRDYGNREEALLALEAALSLQATDRARAAGAQDVHVHTSRVLREIEVEGQSMFIEGTVTAIASGRPRVAHG
ncbi:hydantoinase/oxoprolinase family protein [Nioella nitratireducens]|uniref:hydantoinase/oxoprolinase family protein n=1 Tax=Nioella nitratireducens TaxID=1287720 RepID=UPI0008FD6CAD|nr:hydantoinase/oxoprolinase family protein [Nioella nitratireducens]